MKAWIKSTLFFNFGYFGLYLESYTTNPNFY